jgi:hypothetical protein
VEPSDGCGVSSPEGVEDVWWPVTTLPTVVPWPPLKLSPETSS